MILLDLIITEGWAWVIGISLFIFIILYYTSVSDNNKLIQERKDTELLNSKKNAELKFIYQEQAIVQFEKFKQDEILSIQKNANEAALPGASFSMMSISVTSLGRAGKYKV